MGEGQEGGCGGGAEDDLSEDRGLEEGGLIFYMWKKIMTVQHDRRGRHARLQARGDPPLPAGSKAAPRQRGVIEEVECLKRHVRILSESLAQLRTEMNSLLDILRGQFLQFRDNVAQRFVQTLPKGLTLPRV